MEKRWDFFFLTIYLRSLSKLLRSLRKRLLAKHQHFSQETLHLLRIFFAFTQYISIQQQNLCSPRNFVFSCKTFRFVEKHCASWQNVCVFIEKLLRSFNILAINCKTCIPQETLCSLAKRLATFLHILETLLYLCCNGNNIRQKEKLYFCAFLRENKRFASRGGFPGEFNPFTREQ